MAFSAPPSSTKQLLVPASKLYVGERGVAAAITNERYLGETDTFSISVAGTSIQEFSTESGLKELIDTVLTGVTRTGKMTVKQINRENMALFLAAAYSVQTQAAGTVTGEAHTVLPDRYYQLGSSDSNPSGVRDVSAVSIAAGSAAVAWVADTVTALGALIKATTSPTYFYQATAVASDAKTHASTEPTWPTTVGATVVDDAVTWTCVGILSPALTTDYTIDATLGRVYVVPGARVHATLGTPWAVTYTTAAREREQIITKGTVSNAVALHLVSNNIRGADRDWLMLDCTLTPGGDFSLKLEDPAYVALPFEVGVNKPSAGAAGEDIAAIYIDGRPVA